ncbi:hypothetical protein MRX96_018247 [Rhipicephalus microplus]
MPVTARLIGHGYGSGGTSKKRCFRDRLCPGLGEGFEDTIRASAWLPFQPRKAAIEGERAALSALVTSQVMGHGGVITETNVPLRFQRPRCLQFLPIDFAVAPFPEI